MTQHEPLPFEVTPRQAAEMLCASPKDHLLLDCRTPEEFATCRVDGAVLIPMQEIEDRLAELAGRENDTIIVQCHHGRRSLRVMSLLRQRGFEKAVSMAGGIDRWSLEIDPTVPRY